MVSMHFTTKINIELSHKVEPFNFPNIYSGLCIVNSKDLLSLANTLTHRFNKKKNFNFDYLSDIMYKLNGSFYIASYFSADKNLVKSYSGKNF